MKIFRICLGTFLGFLIVIFIFLCVWYFGDSYKEFYNKTRQEFYIQGLNEGWTPQGITYDKSRNIFLTCGYMKDKKSPSRIYVVDALTNKTIKYFTIKGNNGFYTGHAGGITTDGTSIWMCGSEYILEIDANNAQNIKNKDYVSVKSKTNLSHRADYCFIEQNNLWIGEFENGKKYKLPSTHKVKTNNGEYNTALAFCYKIDHSKKGGADFLNINKILSTPRLVQGMAIIENKVVISTSYSLPNSHIYTYDNVFNKEAKEIVLNEKTYPLYILEEQNFKEDIEAPAMSEEIVFANNRIYILFENAAQKYSTFTREKLKNVYSIEIK